MVVRNLVPLALVLSSCAGTPPAPVAAPVPPVPSFVSSLEPSVALAGRVNDVDGTLAPFLDVLAELGVVAPAACEGRWTGWAESISVAVAYGQLLIVDGPIAQNALCAAALPAPFDDLTREDGRMVRGDLGLVAGSGPRRALALAAAATEGADVEVWADAQSLMPARLRDQLGSIVTIFGLDGEVATTLVQEIIAVGLAIRVGEERALRVHLILPEGVDRAATITLLEGGRDRLLAEARNSAEALAGDGMSAPIQRAIAMGASVRFQVDAGGIVADADASLSDLAQLATAAIPAFNAYVRAAKASEARSNLLQLFMGLSTYYAEFQTVPQRAGPLPANPSAEAQAVDFQTDEVFTWLAFGPIDPVYYSYSLVPTNDPNVVILRAEGDLDGDGVRSRFELTVTCEPTNGCARSELREESPGE